jgi:hypothetical protein
MEIKFWKHCRVNVWLRITYTKNICPKKGIRFSNNSCLLIFGHDLKITHGPSDVQEKMLLNIELTNWGFENIIWSLNPIKKS